MRVRESMAALLMLALLPACGGDDSVGPADEPDEEVNGPVTLARLATEIFTPRAPPAPVTPGPPRRRRCPWRRTGSRR